VGLSTRRWLRRVTTTVGTTTAGSVAALAVLAGPVAHEAPAAGRTTALVADAGAARTAGRELVLVAAHPRRWPGHPGRRILLHRVRPGETATGLAVRFHAYTAELLALNHLGRHGRLYVGRRLRIPVVVAAARKHHRKHAHVHVHRNRHPHRHSHGHPHRHHRTHQAPKPWRHAGASRAEVRRVIVRTARRHGVGPRVALAIAWQESGWQQRRTSAAGAVGAMQVMPGTGRWMSLYAHRRLDLYDLHDNVTAGVLLFRVLRGEAGWKRSIAAYYQGLGALRRHGMYPSTRHYTRTVIAIYRRLGHGWNPS
jgi:hypothetical protein